MTDLVRAPDAALPDDVVRLVVAARHVAYSGLFPAFDEDEIAAIKELDQATEAFAERVRWDDEPEGDR